MTLKDTKSQTSTITIFSYILCPWSLWTQEKKSLCLPFLPLPVIYQYFHFPATVLFPTWHSCWFLGPFCFFALFGVNSCSAVQLSVTLLVRGICAMFTNDSVCESGSEYPGCKQLVQRSSIGLVLTLCCQLCHSVYRGPLSFYQCTVRLYWILSHNFILIQSLWMIHSVLLLCCDWLLSWQPRENWSFIRKWWTMKLQF